MFDFILIRCTHFYKMRKCWLHILNWEYVKLTTRYISYCRLISSFHFTFLYQVLSISLILVQWQQIDHNNFFSKEKRVIIINFLAGLLFIEFFKYLFFLFFTIVNFDILLSNKQISSSLFFFFFSLFIIPFLLFGNLTFKIPLLLIHTLATFSIKDVMILDGLYQLDVFSI